MDMYVQHRLYMCQIYALVAQDMTFIMNINIDRNVIHTHTEI